MVEDRRGVGNARGGNIMCSSVEQTRAPTRDSRCGPGRPAPQHHLSAANQPRSQPASFLFPHIQPTTPRVHDRSPFSATTVTLGTKPHSDDYAIMRFAVNSHKQHPIGLHANWLITARGCTVIHKLWEHEPSGPSTQRRLGSAIARPQKFFRSIEAGDVLTLMSSRAHL